MVKGCLLFVGSIVGGLGIGLGVTVVLRVITGDDDLASAIGTGVWLIAVLTIRVYAFLWFADPDEIANSPRPSTTIRGWSAQEGGHKLQAAELRMGFVFAMIGGATAAMISGSKLVITVVALCCAIVGGLVGFDVKRRVHRIRERFASHNDDDGE